MRLGQFYEILQVRLLKSNVPLTGESVIVLIVNGNRTEWSPIRSVIVQVIGRPRIGSLNW